MKCGQIRCYAAIMAVLSNNLPYSVLQ